MSANTTPKQTRNLASAWQTTLTQPPPVNEWVVDVTFAESTKENAPQFFVVELRYEVTRRCVAVRRFAEFRRLLKEVRRCELTARSERSRSLLQPRPSWRWVRAAAREAVTM